MSIAPLHWSVRCPANIPLVESIGYIGRILSHFNPYTLSPYIMQTLLLLVAPALFAASIYMILGRLILTLSAEHHSLIRLKWLTKIFVTGDVFSFLLQAAGGGLMSGGTLQMMKLGENVVIAGLFFQIIFFSVFVVTAILFQIRIEREPTPMSRTIPKFGKTGWMTLLRILYSASALILVRSIFRVIEYIQGNAGYLLRNEVWLYVFDSILMLSVMVLFNAVHPSMVVPGGKRTRGDFGSVQEEGNVTVGASSVDLEEPKGTGIEMRGVRM